ncbi:uncharacterized protein FSUBG_12015 [Fusarium subglutinans]|uniref:Uncharacterized protein n=1 Tax=Gibberella subglutinans TaxID=42677 RepID=A0A8H5L8J5_GIBSU|nr:uncharacterized protein FSUBG_12015 [Fusarium subglutinans]KAF5586804.1 hypothetical protein FSUBG_12015 [Fusarium subglutinans]
MKLSTSARQKSYQHRKQVIQQSASGHFRPQCCLAPLQDTHPIMERFSCGITDEKEVFNDKYGPVGRYQADDEDASPEEGFFPKKASDVVNAPHLSNAKKYLMFKLKEPNPKHSLLMAPTPRVEIFIHRRDLRRTI